VPRYKIAANARHYAKSTQGRIMNRKLLAFFVCILFLSGCGNDSSQNKPALEQNNWNLISYGFQLEEKYNVLENTSYTLSFVSSSEVSGSIDCNSFVSSYESDAVRLNFEQIAPTEIACAITGNTDYEAQNNFVLNSLATAQ
jgi:heat shock protein HslJ